MATNLSSMNEVLVELKAAMGRKERPDHTFHIVFVGASGAGKTSLLNLFGLFGAMNDGGFDMHAMTNFKAFNDMQLERAQNNPMASKTSSPKSYDMKIGDVTLKITDTPGLGVDTAGIGKEKEHVKNIVEYLKTVDFVDCVCLVINGRTPRSIEEVTFAFSEISAILPNVVNNNTIICLTNAESLFHTTIELNILKDFFKCDIERDKTFCIDNPLCQLERARKLKQDVNQERMKQNFESASTEFKGVLLRVKDFNPLPTTCFMEVYSAKQAVERENTRGYCTSI